MTSGFWHVVIGESLRYGRRCVPDENGALGASGDDEPLVRGNGDLCDLTGVADTLVVADTLIVVPKLDDLVVS